MTGGRTLTITKIVHVGPSINLHNSSIVNHHGAAVHADSRWGALE
jgi:hypothetical protein